ncbi:MAG: hypothetical protein ACWA41_02430 [Putridiphycobacter sp.]
MKKLFLVILLASLYGNAQLPYKELVKAKLYNSLAEANTSKTDVIRLRAHEFSTKTDGFALAEYPDLQVLDLDGANLEYMPLGIKKLQKLEYLNLSNTNIQFVYGVIKKMKSLKQIGLVNTKVSQKEKQKIEQKLGVKVISNLKNLDKLFDYGTTVIQETEYEKDESITVQNSASPSRELSSIKNATTLLELDNRYKLKTFKSILDVKPGEEHLVETLSVDAAGFDKFLKTVGLYTNLYALDLFMVPYVPESISQLTKLKALTILVEPAGESKPFPNLNLNSLILYESFYPHQQVPKWLKNNKDLQVLSITTSSNLIISELSEFKKLKRLRIELPFDDSDKLFIGLKSTKGLEKLTDLEELYVQTGQNLVVDPQISQLKNLKIFDVKITPSKTSGFIDELPESFGALTSLEVFKADVIKFPTSFKKLTKLRVLDNYNNFLSGLAMENLLPSVSYLRSLEVLKLRLNENLIDVSNLNKMIELTVLFKNKSCQIKGLDKLVNLEKLYLYNCKLDVYNYNAIPALKYLKVLKLEACELKVIINRIQNLAQLEELSLRYNKIDCLPPFLWEMQSLKKTDFFGNPIYKTSRDKCEALNSFLKK